MNTNIATAAGTAVGALKNLKAGLQNVRAAAPSTGAEGILKLGKDGKWCFGAENLEIEPGSRWAVNPLSIKHGFVCWKVIPEGSKDTPEKLGEVMVSMFEPKPNPAELPDYGHPWADCIGFTLKCLDGEDKGEQVSYAPTSKGGLRAIGEFLDRFMAHEDDATPVPVLVLKSDFYMHKQYGKTYFPVFDIVGWMGMDGVSAEDDEPEAEAAQQPAEQPRRRAAPVEQEPVEDDEGEEEAPVEQPVQQQAEGGERRRRRRG